MYKLLLLLIIIIIDYEVRNEVISIIMAYNTLPIIKYYVYLSADWSDRIIVLGEFYH